MPFGSLPLRPASFRYVAPDSLEEAISSLHENKGSAKVLAGGQSLVALMAFRLVRPSVLVDLRRIRSLTSYHLRGDTLSIGSMVTHRTVELDRRITSRCTMLEEALDLVGHVAIRNVGTVGGSIAHADPAAEWPAVALALGAQMTIAGPAGFRVVSAEEFFVDWMTTCMATDEVLVSTEITLPGSGTGSAFEEVARRHGDFAIVGAAATVTVVDSVVTSARIALAGAAPTPIRARSAETLLTGSPISAATLETVGEAASAEADPIADLHGSESYRRRLASVLARRAVDRAYHRATA